MNLSCHADIYQVASDSGYEVKEANKTDGRWYAWIDVAESPDSPRLTNLLRILEVRYGFKPWPHAVFDMRQRDNFFGVERRRTFSKKEIDLAEYLSFFCSTKVGHAMFRTDEQFAENRYVVDEVANLKKDPAMGCLQPFNAMAAMPRMRQLLLKRDLIGLNVDEEVIGSNGNLFKLGSDIVLPRSLTRLVNGQGEDVDPDVWKESGVSPWISRF